MFLKKLIWSIKQNQVRRMVSYIVPALDCSGNLLDVGSSGGLISQGIKERASIDVVCIDVLCPPNARIPVIVYDGKKIPFPDNHFTNVLLCFVLHHCDDPVEVLMEAKRVCSHRLIVVEDIAETPFQNMKAIFKDWFYNKITVPDMQLTYKFKSTAEWKRIFEQAGLKLVYTEATPSMPINPVKQTLFALDKINQ